MSELYIVTGAEGHVGNTVIRRLVQIGKNVRGLVLPGASNGALKGVAVKLYKGNLLIPETLDPLFETDTPEQVKVIHTAGIVSIASRYRQDVFDVNVMGTKNLINCCRRHGVRRILYTSSVHAIPEKPKGEVIAEPSSLAPKLVEGLYAKTKARATQFVLQSRRIGLEPVVVYPSGILGPGDYGHGHLTQLVRDYLSGRLFACVKGGYDFVDVRDVAEGIVKAVDAAPAGEGYVLSGHYCAVQELLRLLHQISGQREVKTVLPLWFAKGTAPLSEMYYRLRHQPPLYTRYSLFTLGTNACFSHKKATEQFGYKSRPLFETLKDTVKWLRQHD